MTDLASDAPPALPSVRTLLFWLALACLLPAAIGTGILFFHMYQDGRAQLEKNTIQIARALVLSVDSQLMNVQAVALTLAGASSLATRDFAAFHREASALLEKAGVGSSVVLSDESGVQIVNTARPFGEPLPLRGNLAQVRRVFASGQPLISDIFISRVTGKPVVAVYVPVLSKGRVVYVLGIGIMAQQFSQILLSQRLSPDWVTSVYDSTGTIAGRTHAADEFVGQKGSPEIIARLLAAPEGTLQATSREGIPTYVYYSRSPLSQWSVGIGIPRQSLDAGLLHTLSLLALGMVILFGVSVGLAWFMGGRISRSVRALSAPAAALEAGEALVVSQVHFREADEVARAMARTAQLLVQRVASRTAELQKTRDEAEAANSAKGAFLATMSHELRTPLNAVIGLTGLLADSPLGRRQRNYVEKIQLSAQALRALINDILDFSKIEAGEMRLEQAPFSLSAILRTTATVLGVALRNKPIEALFEVAPDVPDALIGDALRLQQILLNLTGNAVKFTEIGDIVVSVRCLAREDGQVTLQFAIRDTGIGIPSEQLQAIFDGFAQANTSTSRLYGGSGLGLSISARLASLMGGQIEVDSELGQGSEFRLRASLALGIGSAAALSPAIPTALSVLIIDDHALSRDILTQTCAHFGWQATAVESGAAGLAELQRSVTESQDYDLLLLDWHMPGLDGLTMLRQAYATPGIGLPLVVLMASLFEMEQAVAVSDDVFLDGIVAKPMTPASLLEAVTRAYSGETATPLVPLSKTDRRLAGMRLLVAEDNELNQEVIEQVLTRAGAEVVLAANGLIAVAALKVPGARFDAVLMDIHMPVMDGYTATRIIREELGRLDLPIIAVTAFARPEDREKSRLAGMVGHVVKPLDVEDLLDLVAKERQGSVEGATVRADPAPQACAPAIDLAGLDVAVALQVFGGDGQRYAQLLRKFVVQHGGDAAEADRLYTAGDPRGAISLLHGLSGVASILQARELMRLAAATESALLDGTADVVPLLFEALQVAMQSVKASVEQFEARQVGT